MNFNIKTISFLLMLNISTNLFSWPSAKDFSGYYHRFLPRESYGEYESKFEKEVFTIDIKNFIEGQFVAFSEKAIKSLGRDFFQRDYIDGVVAHVIKNNLLIILGLNGSEILSKISKEIYKSYKGKIFSNEATKITCQILIKFLCFFWEEQRVEKEVYKDYYTILNDDAFWDELDLFYKDRIMELFFNEKIYCVINNWLSCTFCYGSFDIVHEEAINDFIIQTLIEEIKSDLKDFEISFINQHGRLQDILFDILFEECELNSDNFLNWSCYSLFDKRRILYLIISKFFIEVFTQAWEKEYCLTETEESDVVSGKDDIF